MTTTARPAAGFMNLLFGLTLGAAAVHAQGAAPALIPPAATHLQGTPAVKIEITEAGATRHVLSPREAATDTLSIRIDDGRLFWTRAGGAPLTMTTAGEMTYLSSSTEPGRYVRLRKVNDRLTYVEHLDLGSRSVTYWGEIRIRFDR